MQTIIGKLLVWQTNLIVVFIMFGFFLAKNKTCMLLTGHARYALVLFSMLFY